MYTFEGNDITDILMESSKINDPRERNRVFQEQLEAIVGRPLGYDQTVYAQGVLSGMNAMRQYLSEGQI